MKLKVFAVTLCVLILALPSAGWGQAPQPPPKVYTGSLGAGFAKTSGNTDTSNFNVTFDMTRDPKKKNVIKFNLLYLRSAVDANVTTDRLVLGFRDEYNLSKRTFLYGALGYLRDPFKDISYMINPQGGVGYKLYTTDRATFALSGGGGSVWEKDRGIEVHASGTLNAGENFSYKLSDVASINQVISALWKTSDFNDALYHFGAALTMSITKRVQTKLEFIDDFKNVTPSPAIKKNDLVYIWSFLYKF
jgi:putative salt-induced outer membrane protein YdiY